MYEKNRFAKKVWKTIVIIKDAMLINNSLPSNFWAKIIETANYLYNRLFTISKNHGK